MKDGRRRLEHDAVSERARAEAKIDLFVYAGENASSKPPSRANSSRRTRKKAAETKIDVAAEHVHRRIGPVAPPVAGAGPSCQMMDPASWSEPSRRTIRAPITPARGMRVVVQRGGEGARLESRVVVQQEQEGSPRDLRRLIARPQEMEVLRVRQDAGAIHAGQKLARLVGRGVIDDDDLGRHLDAVPDRLQAAVGERSTVVDDDDDRDQGLIVRGEDETVGF